MNKTRLALDIEKKIRESYPKLADFYQDWMGNFMMTPKELENNRDDVQRWMDEHTGYRIVDEDGLKYLTDF